MVLCIEYRAYKLFWKQEVGDQTVFSIYVGGKVYQRLSVWSKVQDQERKCLYFQRKPQKKIRLQDTRKIGCHAHIQVKHYIVFPEYTVEDTGMTAKQVRNLKEEKMKELKLKIRKSSSDLLIKRCYFVSLPTSAAHSGHLTGVGVEGGLSQKVNPCISKKISELVNEGMVDYHEVKRSLKHYVKHVLPVMKGIDPPSEDNRAFYPSDKDIQNHIYMAKRAFMLSNLDQENLHLKIENWRKECYCITSLHFFRPYG